MLNTERLTLRNLTLDDATFVNHLYSYDEFRLYLGQHQQSNIKETIHFMQSNLLTRYLTNDYQLKVMQLRNTQRDIGLVGLTQRPWLNSPDLGFGLLPNYTNLGYAYEGCLAILKYLQARQELTKISSITAPDNLPAIRLLGKLNFKFCQLTQAPNKTDTYCLYELKL